MRFSCPSLLLFFVLSASSAAQEVTPLSAVGEARALADRAMAQVKAGKPTQAYEVMRPHWPLPKAEIDALGAQTDAQRATIDARFGRSLDTEFVGTQKIGEAFVRFVYIERYQRHALVWQFTFYRPSDGWVVNSVSYSDQLEPLYRWE